MAWLTIAVGAEGVAETEGEPWIRPATEEEKQEFIKQRQWESPKPEKFDLGSFLIDSTGRPYFLMSVNEEEAPDMVAERARDYTRVKRLE